MQLVSNMALSGWFTRACLSKRDELQTFRTQDLSFPRTKGTFVPRERKLVPGTFRSRGTKVLWNFRSRALSFSGTFVPGQRKFLGTFVPGTFRTRELSFPYLCALVYNSSLGAARISVFHVPINVARRTKCMR